VHRRPYLDYVGVKKFDAEGNVIGERRFLGLFSCLTLPAPHRDRPRAQQAGGVNCATFRKQWESSVGRCGFMRV
jgi:NAD-specific glutamate dehydrogenase